MGTQRKQNRRDVSPLTGLVAALWMVCGLTEGVTEINIMVLKPYSTLYTSPYYICFAS